MGGEVRKGTAPLLFTGFAYMTLAGQPFPAMQIAFLRAQTVFLRAACNLI